MGDEPTSQREKIVYACIGLVVAGLLTSTIVLALKNNGKSSNCTSQVNFQRKTIDIQNINPTTVKFDREFKNVPKSVVLSKVGDRVAIGEPHTYAASDITKTGFTITPTRQVTALSDATGLTGLLGSGPISDLKMLLSPVNNDISITNSNADYQYYAPGFNESGEPHFNAAIDFPNPANTTARSLRHTIDGGFVYLYFDPNNTTQISARFARYPGSWLDSTTEYGIVTGLNLPNNVTTIEFIVSPDVPGGLVIFEANGKWSCSYWAGDINVPATNIVPLSNGVVTTLKHVDYVLKRDGQLHLFIYSQSEQAVHHVRFADGIAGTPTLVTSNISFQATDGELTMESTELENGKLFLTLSNYAPSVFVGFTNGFISVDSTGEFFQEHSMPTTFVSTPSNVNRSLPVALFTFRETFPALLFAQGPGALGMNIQTRGSGRAFANDENLGTFSSFVRDQTVSDASNSRFTYAAATTIRNEIAVCLTIYHADSSNFTARIISAGGPVQSSIEYVATL